MKKRLLTMVLTFSLLLSTTASVFATESLNGKTLSDKEVKTTSIGKVDENEEKTVVVVLKENSKIDYEVVKTEEGKKKRVEETKVLREAFISALEKTDVKFEKLYEYDFLFAGLALKVKAKDIETIKDIDLVESVEVSNSFLKPVVREKEEEFESRRFRSVDSNKLINVTDELYRKYKGEGRVVAVLDTGIDVSHPILRVSDAKKGKYPNENSMKEKMKEVGIDYGSWRNDKVVYAHNYFTNGENVKEEIKEDSHGMHVSGTAVGNPEKEEVFGSEQGEKRERIIGVAPEAQLIFMGVFNGEVTYTHMYAKALEDAVKLGADSVNLSLGAPNGTEEAVGKSMDKAIEFARKAGVIVAIAAGNDGHFGFDYKSGKPPVTNPDYGTVGSPGTSRSALTVAAMYTTVDRLRTIRIKDENGFIRTGEYFKGKDEDGDLKVDFVPDGKDTEEHDIVDGGLGRKQDLENKNIKDKVVVIKRGEISFGEKIVNAQEKEAKGVIIYNHEDGGQDIINMIFQEWTDKIKIPSVFIGNEGGKKLLSNLNKKVVFSKKLTVTPYADGGQLTDFSSYGLSADGTFKPDITAPGGLIYSSINNNKYASMNGTSMATPHVAGATAIIRQAFNERHPEIKGSEEYDTIKAIMMSTADPVKERISENYFSPRKQGAGALNVEKAIASDLYVVDGENNPKAFLGNIENDTVEMKLKVKNIGSTEKTLTYKTVLGTDEVKDGKFNLTTKLLDTINGETIKVPAKGETEVKITIDAKKYDEQLKPLMPNGHFLEGFVFFNEVDGQKAVSIAFSGFRGNWSSVNIWEKPIYDFDFSKKEFPNYFYNTNGLISANFTQISALENNFFAAEKSIKDKQGNNIGSFYGSYGEIPLGYDPIKDKFLKDKIAFSPNNDRNKDFVEFKGVAFRNAQYVYATVEDKDGKEVFKSGTAYVAKHSNNYKPENEAPRSTAVDATAWYGIDSNTKRKLPDGIYKYKLHANPDNKGAKEQTLEFDIILDTIEPDIDTSVKIDKSTRTYKPVITDELSGIERTIMSYISKDTGKTVYLLENDINDKGEFILPNDVDLDNLANIAIHTFDYAGNIVSINLDGSDYEHPSVDLGANIKPIFNVMNLRDINGKHIEGSENLNLFPIEINWRQKVGLFNHSKNDYQEFNYSNELINVEPGKYDIFLSEIPEVYEPLKINRQTVEVNNGEMEEVSFKTNLKDEPLGKGNGEYTVQLLLHNNGYVIADAPYQMSYKLKDANGNEINRDNLGNYVKLYNIPVYDRNNDLVGVKFNRKTYTKLPAGEYTAEATTYDEDGFVLRDKVVKFEIKEGETTVVPFKADIKIRDVVNVMLDFEEDLPKGTKVILVDDSGEEIEIPEAKLNKKVFSVVVDNGDYTIKVVLPKGYEAERNDIEISVDDNKVVEVVKIKKAENPEVTNEYKWVQNPDGTWNYQTQDGKVKIKDQWKEIDNKWYLFDKDGKMLENQWVKSGDVWYWLEPNGSMSENEWIYVDGSWFYAKPGGYIAENEWIYVDGSWFYAKPGGYIAENEWLYIKEKWYYAKDGGYIAQNETIRIFLRYYKFDDNGEWVN